jgi:hypothetical protein
MWNRCVLGRVFRDWRRTSNVTARRKRDVLRAWAHTTAILRAQPEMADAVHLAQTTVKAFNAWRVVYKRTKSHNAKIELFQRTLLARRTRTLLLNWRDSLRWTPHAHRTALVRGVRALQRHAAQKSRMRVLAGRGMCVHSWFLLQHALAQWRAMAHQAALDNKAKQALMVRAWHRWTQRRLALQHTESGAATRSAVWRTQEAWSVWRMHFLYRENEHTMTQIADAHAHRAAKQRVVRELQHYTRTQQEHLTATLELSVYAKESALRRGLRQWRAYTLDRRALAPMQAAARTFCIQHSWRGLLLSWRRRSKLHALHEVQK